MIAWVHIFTAMEFALTATARYAASANPWTEATKDNVPHFLMGQIANSTGRLGWKCWETDIVSSYLYYFGDYSLPSGLSYLFENFFVIYTVILNFIGHLGQRWTGNVTAISKKKTFSDILQFKIWLQMIWNGTENNFW